MKDTRVEEPKNQILSDEEALLLDHDYDGIQELDHPLPQWWLWLFYISIAFSIVYSIYYMTGIGPTLRDELRVALQEIQAKKPAQSTAGGVTDEMLLAILEQADRLKNGQEVFVGKCAACHGDKGQGLIGPNLTDDQWMHGAGSPMDIMELVRVGIPTQGMPPWVEVLTPDELLNVSAYVYSIRGSNPPGAKPPEGPHGDH